VVLAPKDDRPHRAAFLLTEDRKGGRSIATRSARAGRHRPSPRSQFHPEIHEETTRIYRVTAVPLVKDSAPLRSAALAAGLTPLRGLPLIYRAALKPSHHPPIYDRFSYPRLAASFGAPLDARDAGGAVPRRGMVLRGDLALRPSRPTVTEARSALHAPSLLLST
jgi:hypothetical protein